MPEGDTIFRAARTLHRALAGKPVVRFESVFPALTRVHDDTPLTGRTVERVVGRQARADALLRRPRPAHAHAHERQLAHLPARRSLAAAAARHARAWSRRTDFEAVGFNVPVAEFIAASGPGAARRAPAARPRPARRDASTRPRRCAGMRARPARRDRRRAAQPARHGRHRQRLQVGGAVRVRREPVRDGARISDDARCDG